MRITVFSEDKVKLERALALAQSMNPDHISLVSTGPNPFADEVTIVEEGDEESEVAEIVDSSPDLVILGDGRRDITVGSRVAGRLRASFASQVTELKVEGKNFRLKRLAYGGISLATINGGLPLVASVLNSPQVDLRPRAGKIKQGKRVEGKVKITSRSKPSGTVDITGARVIVAVGRGIGSQDKIKYAEELASALGGTVAGSRPVTAELKWLPEERQVGLSGNRVRPKVYIALGISGQPQHLAGMKDSGLVITVNTDKNAPFSESSDYFVVADAVEFAKELTKRLRS